MLEKFSLRTKTHSLMLYNLNFLIMTCEHCDSDCPSKYSTSYLPFGVENKNPPLLLHAPLCVLSHTPLILPFLRTFLTSLSSAPPLAPLSSHLSIIVIINHL